MVFSNHQNIWRETNCMIFRNTTHNIDQCFIYMYLDVLHWTGLSFEDKQLHFPGLEPPEPLSAPDQPIANPDPAQMTAARVWQSSPMYFVQIANLVMTCILMFSTVLDLVAYDCFTFVNLTSIGRRLYFVIEFQAYSFVISHQKNADILARRSLSKEFLCVCV